ncbi:MAG: zf-HC2 domain-containing protein [Bacteroidales bacterium]|nr:zf-HC2 domain-containing protein [Bacteroidales bacterium]
MKCKKVHTRLLSFYEGTLPQGEMEQVKRHLDQCETCRQLYHQILASWKMAGEERIPYQPFFYTRVRQRMANQSRPAGSRVRHLARTAIQPALFFVVLGLGITIGIQLGKGIGSQQTAQVENQQNEYLEAYAENQFWNGFQLESLEQELFFADTTSLTRSLNKQEDSHE